MRRVLFGTLTAMAFAGLAPPGAEAQDAEWWEWALEEAVERRYDDRYDEDRYDGFDDRHDRYRGGDGYLSPALIEIILGRGDRRDRRDDRWDRRDRRDRGRNAGPPFCRNGRGHPVHGRQWCREKGYGDWRYDRRRGYYDGRPVIWDRRGGWGDIILRNSTRHRRAGVLSHDALIAILGVVIVDKLVQEARLDRRDRIHGRWVMPGGRADVLQIRSGSRPVAELTDVNRDGRVDAVLVPRR